VSFTGKSLDKKGKLMDYNDVAGRLAIAQIDYISKMYAIKDELYKQIIDLSVEIKQLERRVQKLESFISDTPHMLSNLAKRISFLEMEHKI
jgi:hypothetical protein